MPKITIRVANAEKLETQFLPELASGGLFIRSDKFLPLGAEVDIDLYLPSATDALPLKGRVTKVVDDDDARARKATGMTLAVDATSEPTRSRLDALYTAYKIPVKRPGQSSQSNGAYGNAVPLPPPSSLTSNAAIPLPPPSSRGGGSDAIPLPPPSSAAGGLPSADEDLPAPRGATPPAIPSIAPAIPSIAPVAPVAPAATKGNPSVPVVRFDKPNGKHGPAHDAFSEENSVVTNPYRTIPSLDDSPPDLTPVKPLPFPFQRQEPPKQAEVPSFSSLNSSQPAAATPPPPPPAAAETPSEGTGKLEVRVRELEAAEAKARADAKKALADKEATEAKHAEATKRLNDEIAALQRRPQGGGRSPLPAALIGLLLGAGAMYALLTFVMPPQATTTTSNNTNVATTGTNANNTVAVVGANDNTGNTGSGNNGSGATDKPAVDNGNTPPNNGAVVAMNAVADAGQKPAEVAAAVKPEEKQPVDTAAKPEVKDAGTTMLAQADVGGTKTDVKPEEKTPPVNPEKVAEDPPALAKIDPPKEDKKEPPKDEPIGENAGVLNLRADMPATVYVNGKKVGAAPALGVKANPGKITVRFDCIVEDVRVRGKNRIVNLEPNGKASLTYSCVE